MISTADKPGLNPKAQLRLYGQEINDQSYAVCKSDLLIKGYDATNIQLGDTLADDRFAGETFDYCLSNPLYSIRWDGDASPLLINDPRFSPAGVLAPKSKVDLAFTMHILSWLAVDGTAAIVEFPGVLYRGGPSEKPAISRRQQLHPDCHPAPARLLSLAP